MARTFSKLMKLEEPNETKKDTSRITPVEFTVFRVRMRLIEYGDRRTETFMWSSPDP